MRRREVPAQVVDAVDVVHGGPSASSVTTSSNAAPFSVTMSGRSGYCVVQGDEQVLEARRVDVPAHLGVRPGLREELDVLGAGPRRAAHVLVPVGVRARRLPVPHLAR